MKTAFELTPITYLLLFPVFSVSLGQDICDSTCQSESPPRVNITDFHSTASWRNDWEIANPIENAISIVANSSSDKIYLALRCDAEYEIYWEYQNSQSQSQQSQSREITKGECWKFVNSTSKYLINLFMEFAPDPDVPSITTVSCEHPIKDLATVVNIFLPGKKALIDSNKTVRYRKNEYWVKCPTSRPNANVSLYSISLTTNQSTKIDAPYTPTIGFKLPTFLSGVYECRVGTNDIVRVEPENGTDILSLFAYTYTILHKDVATKCKNSDVALLSNTDYDLSNQNRNRNNSETSKGIQTWISDLTIDNKQPYVINVIGKGTSLILDLHCIKDEAPGVSGRVTSQWQIIPLPFHQGDEIVNSIEESFYSATKEQEQSMDKVNLTLGRFEWKEKKHREVFIDGENIVYLNDTSTFNCSTTSPDLVITFWLGFQNGTFIRITIEQFEGLKITPLSNSIQCIRGLRLSELQVPEGASSFSCRVNTKRHPTMYQSDTLPFTTAYTRVPHVTSEKNECNEDICTFFIGETHRKLKCPLTGSPPPTFEWRKWMDDSLLQKDLSDHKFGSLRSQTLEFPSITELHKGNYSCTATNKEGSESYFFQLDVQDNSLERIFTIIGIVGFVCVVFGLTIFGVGMFRVRKAKKLMRGLTEEEIQAFFKGRAEMADSAQLKSSDNYDMMPYQNQYETEMDDTELDYNTILGKGEFGMVVKGYIKSKGLHVAVKIAKNADIEMFKGMLSEVKILGHIGVHTNVVGLVGATTEDIQNRKIYIYMDLCELGSLEKFLRKNKEKFTNLIDENQKIIPKLISSDTYYSELSFNTLDLIKWAGEIATGMEYLSSKSVVHMDLAARNVLLTRDKTVKVSDFGLSRQLYGANLYKKKTKSPLPWRWMALESLKTVEFSPETDVWSYGVTLWEMFSLGDIPFPHENWTEAFVKQLESGIRMTNPEYCTPEIYARIVACWDNSPSKRPYFGFLRIFFDDMYRTLKPRDVVDQGQGDLLQPQVLHMPLTPDSEPDYMELVPISVKTKTPKIRKSANPFPRYSNLDHQTFH